MMACHKVIAGRLLEIILCHISQIENWNLSVLGDFTLVTQLGTVETGINILISHARVLHYALCFSCPRR